MNTNRIYLLLTLCAGLLSSCASTQICTRDFAKSDDQAAAIVRACQKAHGEQAFSKIRDISVRYEGKWGRIGPRFQPVLVDARFRANSEERLILPQRVMAQAHTGPGGSKKVLRHSGNIKIAYNGTISDDVEANQAAALVADAYMMFLLGPFYFQAADILFAMHGASEVDGELCDDVLAVLKPGFGEAEEDRVVLSISRRSQLLRRVRMTLNGLESTRGAEVDLTFREYHEHGGVLWPTDFDERIRSPFDLHAHHWKLCGLEINRGLNIADLNVAEWTEKAARPAATLQE